MQIKRTKTKIYLYDEFVHNLQTKHKILHIVCSLLSIMFEMFGITLSDMICHKKIFLVFLIAFEAIEIVWFHFMIEDVKLNM